MPHETRSGAAWLACAGPEEVEEFLGGLSENALMSLPWLFEFWALPHQLPPEGDWKSWVIMGGRGAGKTRAGSEWVRRMVEGPTAAAPGQCHRVALVGETFDQVREVMVFGESGILACSPPDRRPVWEAGRRRLVWANGATATVYSAHEPEALRGPQFDAAWVDELAKWKKAEDVWDMLQFALRLGEHPQQVVTTTPRNVGVLKRILGNASTVVTHAPTDANRAYLAESFLAEVESRYGGTRLGRQELDGVLLDDVEGALWTTAMLEAARVTQVPKLDRVVVAVDPSVTGGKASDECGIVVAGVVTQGEPKDWRAYVLEDASVRGGPTDWARAAIAAMDRHKAEKLVAEVNQGGDLVESVVRQIDPLVPFKALRASRGKGLRAEPVAALYEQGRVKHLRGALGALEDQLCQMTVRGFEGRGSPDRLDALVWAVHELMIEPAAGWRRPQMRVL
ncbi:DNA-packaging protein [Paracoccus beibuensis]|uniref:DNA-packaging protein n=1 Tax=Paracoccus beibuensis TaxID=547602 RepID=UPI00223E95F1|nr:terminase family protein [Paracoccus beibuensis]